MISAKMGSFSRANAFVAALKLGSDSSCPDAKKKAIKSQPLILNNSRFMSI